MISWREFVREVQQKNQISYREAMKQASVLWKKKPHYEKKTKPNTVMDAANASHTTRVRVVTPCESACLGWLLGKVRHQLRGQ